MKIIYPFITGCLLFAFYGQAQLPPDTLTCDTIKKHHSQDSMKIRVKVLDTLSSEDIRKIHKQNHPKNPGNHPIATPDDSAAEKPEKKRKWFWFFKREKSKKQ